MRYNASETASRGQSLWKTARFGFFTPSDSAWPGGVEAYRTQKKVFGQSRSIVVTFNQNLYDGQLQRLTAHLAKARRKLGDLQTQLQRRRDGKVKGGKAQASPPLPWLDRDFCINRGHRRTRLQDGISCRKTCSNGPHPSHSTCKLPATGRLACWRWRHKVRASVPCRAVFSALLDRD